MLVKFIRRGGALFVGVACAVIATSPPVAAQTPSLPSGWANRDIGSPQLPGSAESAGDTISVTGAGVGVSGTSDQVHYVYQSASGNIDMVVRVSDLQSENPSAQAGLMIRETLSSRAKQAYMVVSAGEGLSFQWRSRFEQRTSQIDGAELTAPIWIRLVREGNEFRGYSSPTGTEWTLVGTATISMNNSVYVGLAVTSRTTDRTATARFASSAFGTPAPSLPSPWAAADIGSPALGGAATVGNGITVTAGGVDIWDTSDQFHFLYQPVTGDQEIIARVANLQAVDPWSKAGVMIRAELTGPAAHASMFATGSNGWAFQRRLYSGDFSYHTAGPLGAAPGWVRLVREGNRFSAYQSQDGTQWSLVDTDVISMPATIYIGLAVTSHNPTVVATATFTNVGVDTPTASNKPPTVALTSPALGATYTAPAAIAISAMAADVDGFVTRVDFYGDGQLIGSDTAAPFTTTWSGLPAGTYSLTAVATDNGGAKATSLPVLVTVVDELPRPTTLVFVPPVDYATNVDFCTVELRRSGDPVTAAPVAIRNLGKPVPQLGEIAVDISTLVDPLPAGSYYAVVVSTGPGGSTASSPSAAFSK